MNRTTVNISITPELDAFLQSRVDSGRYQTTSEVVREALRLLEQQERERELRFQDLKAKLDQGAGQSERCEVLEAGEVLEELRELVGELRQRKQKVLKS